MFPLSSVVFFRYGTQASLGHGPRGRRGGGTVFASTLNTSTSVDLQASSVIECSHKISSPRVTFLSVTGPKFASGASSSATVFGTMVVAPEWLSVIFLTGKALMHLTFYPFVGSAGPSGGSLSASRGQTLTLCFHGYFGTRYA